MATRMCLNHPDIFATHSSAYCPGCLEDMRIEQDHRRDNRPSKCGKPDHKWKDMTEDWYCSKCYRLVPIVDNNPQPTSD